MRYKVDTEKLKALTFEKLGTIRNLCKASGVSEGLMYAALKRDSTFDEATIIRIGMALRTNPEDFSDYDGNTLNPIVEQAQTKTVRDILRILGDLNYNGQQFVLDAAKLVWSTEAFRDRR